MVRLVRGQTGPDDDHCRQQHRGRSLCVERRLVDNRAVRIPQRPEELEEPPQIPRRKELDAYLLHQARPVHGYDAVIGFAAGGLFEPIHDLVSLDRQRIERPVRPRRRRFGNHFAGPRTCLKGQSATQPPESLVNLVVMSNQQTRVEIEIEIEILGWRSDEAGPVMA